MHELSRSLFSRRTLVIVIALPARVQLTGCALGGGVEGNALTRVVQVRSSEAFPLSAPCADRSPAPSPWRSFPPRSAQCGSFHNARRILRQARTELPFTRCGLTSLPSAD